MRQQSDELRQRLADSEAAYHRLLDAIFKQQFGVEIYNLAADLEPAEPEPELTDDEKRAVELEQFDDIARRKLEWISRTKPSLLAAETRHELELARMRRAAAAHPARAPFEAALAQVRS